MLKLSSSSSSLFGSTTRATTATTFLTTTNITSSSRRRLTSSATAGLLLSSSSSVTRTKNTTSSFSSLKSSQTAVTMPAPRVSSFLLRPLLNGPTRNFVASSRLLSSTAAKDSGKQNSRPGWEGRHGDDHVIHRQELDVQAEASHSGMRQKDVGQEGSNAISEKDEGDHNKKAKQDHPEAPEPVIGMNSERGGKGH